MAKKTEKTEKTEKVKKTTVRGLIVEKVMEGKMTDSAILELVMVTFPDWSLVGKKHYVSWYRWDLGRKGMKDVPPAVKEPKAAKPAPEAPTAKVKVKAKKTKAA